MTVKQIIVMRTDLGMGPGKIASQAAHASMKVLLDSMAKTTDEDGELGGMILAFGSDDNSIELKEWLAGAFTKITVSVKSEKKLMELYEKVKAAGLRVSLITDNGATVFNGVPTKTCIAIGPHRSEIIDPFTKKYPLL